MKSKSRDPRHRAKGPPTYWKYLLGAILVVSCGFSGLLLYAKRWKEKKDAATCVMNIRNFQTGARSYAGLNPDKLNENSPVDTATVYRFMSMQPSRCPSGGILNVHGCYYDPPGTVFLRCSHPKHVPTPAQSTNW